METRKEKKEREKREKMKDKKMLEETKNEIKKEYKKEIEKNGGLTLNHHGEKVEQKSGFVVSIYGEEYKTENLDDAVSVLFEKLEKINGNEHLFVGVWYNEEDDAYYVDINEIIENLEDALTDGRNQKQLAIFDLKTQKSIFIKNYNFTKVYHVEDKTQKALVYILDNPQDVAEFVGVKRAELFKIIKGDRTHARYNISTFYILEDEDGEE